MRYLSDRRTGKLKPLASAIFFLFSAFTISACGTSEPEDLSSAALIVNGVPMEIPFVMKIDNEPVSLDEYRFFYLNVKKQMDGGDPTYWTQPNSEEKEKELKATTLSLLKSTHAVLHLAEQQQLSLTDTELSRIDSDVKSQISALGGLPKYHRALKEKYLNDNLYRQIWKINYCRQKLWSYYFDRGGQFYISDDAISNNEKQTSYNALFTKLIHTTVGELDIQLSDEYDLIGIDTLQ